MSNPSLLITGPTVIHSKISLLFIRLALLRRAMLSVRNCYLHFTWKDRRGCYVLPGVLPGVILALPGLLFWGSFYIRKLTKISAYTRSTFLKLQTFERYESSHGDVTWTCACPCYLVARPTLTCHVFLSLGWAQDLVYSIFQSHLCQ